MRTLVPFQEPVQMTNVTSKKTVFASCRFSEFIKRNDYYFWNVITPHGYCVPDGSAGLHGYGVLCNQGLVGVLGFLVEWKGEKEATDWRKLFHTPAHETDIRRKRAEGCVNEQIHAWTLLRDSTACDDAKEQIFLLSHGLWETMSHERVQYIWSCINRFRSMSTTTEKMSMHPSVCKK